MARQWVRCEDPDTGHQFDVREDKITAAHKVLEDYPTSPFSRPAKPRTRLPGVDDTDNNDGDLADDDLLDPSGSAGDQTSTEES